LVVALRLDKDGGNSPHNHIPTPPIGLSA